MSFKGPFCRSSDYLKQGTDSLILIKIDIPRLSTSVTSLLKHGVYGGDESTFWNSTNGAVQRVIYLS